MPENYYAHLFKNLKDAVYLTSSGAKPGSSKFIDFNAATLRLLGYTEKEMQALSLADILPKKWHASYPLFKRDLKNSACEAFETEHITRDGSLVEVEVNCIFFKCERNDLVYSIVHEISKEKKITNTLKKEIEIARKYFDLAGVIFVSLDLKGKIKVMNQTGCKILGYKTQMVDGKLEVKKNGFTSLEGLDWFETFIPEEDREMMRKLHFDALSKQSLDDEYYVNEVLCKDGSRRMISWHNAFLRDENGTITGSLSSGMDVSERMRAENELHQERERSEKIMMDAILKGQEKERQRIAADLHDSIQPLLSTIKRKVESFKSFTKDLSKEKKQEYQKINSLLNQSLVEIKSISYNLVPPTLKDFGLINTLQDLCENMDLSGKATVHFIASNMDEKLNNDKEMGLYRIAQELLTNSLKHSEADHITLQLIGHEDSVILIIEDDGIGFDNNMRKAGLGMKNIFTRVKNLGGVVDIDSVKGRGSTIIVEVPRKNE
jgi:PAS domain S-box-containing protein